MTEQAHRTNGVDPTVLDRWTKEILRIHDKLDEQKMENMRICKEIREPLPDLYEAAKNAGLPIKAFRAHIKAELAKRNYERTLEKIIPEDEDDQAAFDAMRLIAEPGDLFDHAVKAHEAGEDDNADLRPTHLREAEARRAREASEDEKQADENARRLRGIKPLDESADAPGTYKVN